MVGSIIMRNEQLTIRNSTARTERGKKGVGVRVRTKPSRGVCVQQQNQPGTNAESRGVVVRWGVGR